MKITKGKSRSSNKIRVQNTFGIQKNRKKPMMIEKVSLDQELWEDWQIVVEVDHKRNAHNRRREKTKESKKKSFHPEQIVSTCKFVSVPHLLFRNYEEKVEPPRRSNNILRDFLAPEMSEQLVAKITICRTIVPDEIRQKRRSTKVKKFIQSSETKPSDAEEQSQFDMSMNLDDTLYFNESSSPIKPKTSSFNQETSQISDESPLPHFYSLRNKVISVIPPETRFSFQGKLNIEVLYGAIKVYGAILNKENTVIPVEIYSSRGTSQVSIESTPEKHSGSIAGVWAALSMDNIDEKITNDLQLHVNNLETGWAVVRLQNLENNLTNFLSKYSTHRLFPKLDDVSNYSWSDPKRAEVVLQTNIHPEYSVKQMIGFHRTDNVFDVISRRFDYSEGNSGLRVLFAGGKNVGKSTTARYFVNKLLKTTKSVIFVDLDIGQAEFTPCGCISLNIVKDPLLGPNFTHLKTPHFQLFIGGVDATKHLTNYIEGVRKLTEILDNFDEMREFPVVINTMGFCKGIGWDIMCHIVKSLQPTDVVQIISKKAKNNFDQLLTYDIMNRQNPIWKNWSSSPESEKSCLSYELHVMDTEAETRNSSADVWNIEPHQQREIVMLAYLSQIVKSKKNKHNVTTINEVVPYQVPFSSVMISLGKPLVPQILSVMNGSIVALCGIDLEERDTNLRESEEKVGYPKVLMRAPSSVCYGFGILRGVDMTNEKLYINTPLSLSELKHVNCLIGSMEVPIGLLQLNSLSLPYAGDECQLPTSRDSRRGYFRMKNRN